MKLNMGVIDRIIRLLVAGVVAYLYFTGAISGVFAIVLGVAAAAFVLTSLVGVCPAYSVIGFSTKKKSV